MMDDAHDYTTFLTCVRVTPQCTDHSDSYEYVHSGVHDHVLRSRTVRSSLCVCPLNHGMKFLERDRSLRLYTRHPSRYIHTNAEHGLHRPSRHVTSAAGLSATDPWQAVKASAGSADGRLCGRWPPPPSAAAAPVEAFKLWSAPAGPDSRDLLESACFRESAYAIGARALRSGAWPRVDRSGAARMLLVANSDRPASAAASCTERQSHLLFY